MTSLELLVQELPNLGGWPKNANKLKFSTMKRVVDDVGNEYFHVPTIDRLVLSERVKFVTREQYEEALAATKEEKMKYEYLKGSEKDFEGAPEWATHVIEHKEGNQRAFAEKFDYMCRAVYAADAELYPDSKTVIANPTMWIVIADRELVDVEVTGKSSWDGVGLPPVGCECVLHGIDEINNNNFDVIKHCTVNQWKNGDVLRVVSIEMNGENPIVVVWNDRHKTASGILHKRLKPLRSEADKKRDYAVGAIERCWEESTGKIAYQFEAIYDAIAAGKIPGVKLED